MERLHHLLLAVLVLSVFLWAQLEAIPTRTNVDTEEPSVIRSPAAIDDTDRNDDFGLSAVFHQIETVVENDNVGEVLRKTRIVIGAPRGTFPGGLGHLATYTDYAFLAETQTGLVYSCSVTGACIGVRGNTSLYLPPDASTRTTNGVVNNLPSGQDSVQFYPSRLSEGRLFDQAPNTVLDGFTTAVIFERKKRQFMGAALYSTGDNILACAPLWTTNSRQTRGLCFIGDRSLSNFKTLYPCNDFGDTQCNAGFSADIVNDYIAIGVPGWNRFRGAYFSHLIDGTEFPDLSIYSDNGPGLGSNTNPLNLGFQITHGSITDSDRSRSSDIVISVPRFDGINNYNGEVIVLSASALPLTTATATNRVGGNQTAEFFGYSLATCDLTGDGFDELIVGAPLYTSFDPFMVDRGRVYVYFNDGGSLMSPPVVLNGRSAYGRFGFSVANAGDLDADGFEDLVIGAPYEPSSSSSSNTGAVYVYYGSSSRNVFESQVAQRILADNIVDSVSSLSALTTFGFSLDGNMDVDDNSHSDILVGAPETQAVVVLRTLPFVDVTVNMETNVVGLDLDSSGNPSFVVTITARYSSVSVGGALSVRYNLTERRTSSEDRLFFSQGDRSDLFEDGVFNFTQPGESFTVTVTVYAITDPVDLTDYRLNLDILDKERNLNPVTGQQAISDLSQFPRFRLLGNSSLMLPIVSCAIDSGCRSDVVLMPVIPATEVLVARDSTLDPARVTFNLSYSNIGMQLARRSMLVISNIPSAMLRNVRLMSSGSSRSCTPTMIPPNTLANVTCNLTSRILPEQSDIAELSFTVADAIVGNEPPFNISVEIIVDTTGQNADVNTGNNRQMIGFSVDSVANIGLRMQFIPSTILYDSIQPTTGIGSELLGSSALLRVVVENSGPSVVQDVRVTIMFPSQLPAITGQNYFLYPSSLTSDVLTVNCTLDALDPEKLDGESPQLILEQRRRKRSAPVLSDEPVAVAAYHHDVPQVRSKRQSAADLSLDCAMSECDVIVCDIRGVTVQGVTLSLNSRIDERFYSASANSRTFNLGATGLVAVRSGFQIDDDDVSNNRASANATLMPDISDGGTRNLIHYIIWPSIGGLLILIVLVVLLYFLGFFRRKKKPGEEEEVEGDFNAPPGTAEKPQPEKPQPEKPVTDEQATTV